MRGAFEARDEAEEEAQDVEQSEHDGPIELLRLHGQRLAEQSLPREEAQQRGDLDLARGAVDRETRLELVRRRPFVVHLGIFLRLVRGAVGGFVIVRGGRRRITISSSLARLRSLGTGGRPSASCGATTTDRDSRKARSVVCTIVFDASFPLLPAPIL